MAERRMFAKTIVDSDAFLEMPLSTQALYFHLGMRADDDGFVNAPKKIMRMIGGQEDDLKLLITKKFIIPFNSGIIVIKHWKINNYIRNDRYHATPYREELQSIGLEENGAYTLLLRNGIPNHNQMDTEVRLDKNSIDKYRLDNAQSANDFVAPSVQQIEAYLKERNITAFSAEEFFDYYSACGWTIGKDGKKMKDWKSAVRQWQRKHPEDVPEVQTEKNSRGEVLQ